MSLRLSAEGACRTAGGSPPRPDASTPLASLINVAPLRSCAFVARHHMAWRPVDAWRAPSEAHGAIGEADAREDSRARRNYVVGADRHTLAEHSFAADARAVADPAACGDYAVGDATAGADARPVEHDRAFDGAPGADRDVAAQIGERAHMRSLADAHATLEQRRRDRPPSKLDAVGKCQEVAAETLGDRRLNIALEDVKGRLQVARGRADVQPIACAGIAKQPVADQLRPDLALDRDIAPGGHEVEDLALQDV